MASSVKFASAAADGMAKRGGGGWELRSNEWESSSNRFDQRVIKLSIKKSLKSLGHVFDLLLLQFKQGWEKQFR